MNFLYSCSALGLRVSSISSISRIIFARNAFLASSGIVSCSNGRTINVPVNLNLSKYRRTAVSPEKALFLKMSSYKMQPIAQMSTLFVYLKSSMSSGERYDGVPSAYRVVWACFDVPSEVRPKSAIFHAWSLAEYRTTIS